MPRLANAARSATPHADETSGSHPICAHQHLILTLTPDPGIASTVLAVGTAVAGVVLVVVIVAALRYGRSSTVESMKGPRTAFLEWDECLAAGEQIS